MTDALNDDSEIKKKNNQTEPHDQREEMKDEVFHKAEEVKDRIAVLSYCDASYHTLLQYALGVVLQNHPEDATSEKEAIQIAKTLNIPIVVRADSALSLLHEGQLVTLDPQKKIIYKGSIGSDEEMIPKLCS